MVLFCSLLVSPLILLLPIGKQLVSTARDKEAQAAVRRNLVPKDLPLVSGGKRNGRPRERPIGITSLDHLNHIETRERYKNDLDLGRKGIRFESNGFCRSVSPCASFETFSLCEKSYGCFWTTGCDLGACGLAACLPSDEMHCRDMYDQQSCSKFSDCMWITEHVTNVNKK